MTKSWRPDTKAIHSGEPHPPMRGAVTMPIFQSSTFVQEEDIPAAELAGFAVRYLRLSNSPNHLALGEKLAALEAGEAGAVSASGMAAVSTALLTAVGPGEHVLVQDQLYGGTQQFLSRQWGSLGRSFSSFSPQSPEQWAALLRPETKAIYVEALSNPLLEAFDYLSLISFAKSRQLLTIIDNTFPSPVNFQPLSLGFDVVVHSATKYLNGHSDIVAGATIGPKAFIQRFLALQGDLGACLDPHVCFLLNRGLKTLGVRVRQQNQSALSLARYLEGHPRVRQVYYPGLESHPQHELIMRQFRGFGGMLSFEFGGPELELQEKLADMRLAKNAPSLGGTESLVTRPCTSSHVGMSATERERLGISRTLVRVSVGLEDIADLIEDFAELLD